MGANSTSKHAFFDAWKNVCAFRKSVLLVLWDRRREYTAEIFYGENPVVKELAGRFKLAHYNNYYSIDTIYFDDARDKVHCAPAGQTWVQNIRIAFEHEHIFAVNLFQEVSHLLITRADLRVLVSYPNNEGELNSELMNLAMIINQSDVGRTDPAFLLITGTRVKNLTDIEWRGFEYQHPKFVPLKS